MSIGLAIWCYCGVVGYGYFGGSSLVYGYDAIGGGMVGYGAISSGVVIGGVGLWCCWLGCNWWWHCWYNMVVLVTMQLVVLLFVYGIVGYWWL